MIGPCAPRFPTVKRQEPAAVPWLCVQTVSGGGTAEWAPRLPSPFLHPFSGAKGGSACSASPLPLALPCPKALPSRAVHPRHPKPHVPIRSYRARCARSLQRVWVVSPRGDGVMLLRAAVASGSKEPSLHNLGDPSPVPLPRGLSWSLWAPGGCVPTAGLAAPGRASLGLGSTVLRGGGSIPGVQRQVSCSHGVGVLAQGFPLASSPQG